MTVAFGREVLEGVLGRLSVLREVASRVLLTLRKGAWMDLLMSGEGMWLAWSTVMVGLEHVAAPLLMLGLC